MNIDRAALRAGTGGSEFEACTEAIHAACLDDGFFTVLGHGLDTQLEGAFKASREFFSLPQAHKERVPRVERYGFIPHRADALDRDRASDFIEYLDMGLGDEGPLPDLIGFAEAVRAYQQAALSVAAAILRSLAIALEIGPDFFAERMSKPQCRLRFLHYPRALPDSHGGTRVLNAQHTDYGAITLLATDGVPGLEVRPIGKGWTPVTAPPGSLIVNLGDMLARWTNDRYRSTPHRVLGSPDRDRFSIAFFVNPNPTTVVECIPTCVTKDRPRRYEPVTAGDFLASRIDGSIEPYAEG